MLDRVGASPVPGRRLPDGGAVAHPPAATLSSVPIATAKLLDVSRAGQQLGATVPSASQVRPLRVGGVRPAEEVRKNAIVAVEQAARLSRSRSTSGATEVVNDRRSSVTSIVATCLPKTVNALYGVTARNIEEALPSQPELLQAVLCFIAQKGGEKDVLGPLGRALEQLSASAESATGVVDDMEDESENAPHPVEILMHLREEDALQVARALLSSQFDNHDLAEERLLPAHVLEHTLKSLEKAWGLTNMDMQLMMRFIRRQAYLIQRNSGVETAKESSEQQELSIGLFMSLFPDAVNRLRVKYTHRTAHHLDELLVSPTNNAKRSSFLLQKQIDNLEDNYDKKTQLGSGAFGAVALCVHRPSGSLRAVKTMPVGEGGIEGVSQEFHVLAGLDHPNIVRVFEILFDGESAHIAMEAVLGGTLKDAVPILSKGKDARASRTTCNIKVDNGAQPTLSRVSSAPASTAPSKQDVAAICSDVWIAEVMRQLLLAVKYCHDRGVVHNDLKPLNVLLAVVAIDERPKVVVCDFGIADIAEMQLQKASKGKGIMTAKGTPNYMAPEAFLGGQAGYKADIWSAGVILFELLTGEVPFKAHNILLLSRKVTGKEEPPLINAIESDGGRELCKLLLLKDDKQRPNAAKALEHGREWFERSDDQEDGPWWTTSGASGEDDVSSHVPEIANQLLSLNRRSQLDNCVMACLVSQLNLTELHRLNKTFEHYDVDGNGALDPQELNNVFAEFNIPPADAELIAKVLDADKDGLVQYSEFMAGVLDLRRGIVLRQLRVVFSMFDVDGDGVLEKEELRSVLQARKPDVFAKNGEDGEAAASEDVTPGTVGLKSIGLRSNVTNSSAAGSAAGELMSDLLADGVTIDELMEELDTSGDGVISFQEFRQYILRNTTNSDEA